MGFKFTNRNIPMSVFGLSFIMWAVGLVEGSYCTMFGSGLVISWIYLRFYQLHANGSRGDSFEDIFHLWGAYYWLMAAIISQNLSSSFVDYWSF